MEKREHSLDVLQDRVMNLKEYAKLQKTPLQMQVNAVKTNLEKKTKKTALLQLNIIFSFAIYTHQMGKAPDCLDHLIICSFLMSSLGPGIRLKNENGPCTRGLQPD